MEYFVSILAVVGFGYFIYTRVAASRKRDSERPEGGSGGGSRNNPRTYEK